MNEELLTIDLGIKRYVLKHADERSGEVFVEFNPADTGFAKKIVEAFDKMNSLVDAYHDTVDKEDDVHKMLDGMDRLDADMRKVMNNLFGKDICTDLLGDINIFAMAGGAPIWSNILFAVYDKMEANYSVEKKLSDEKIKKYTEKYKNHGSKYIR